MRAPMMPAPSRSVNYYVNEKASGEDAGGSGSDVGGAAVGLEVALVLLDHLGR